MFNPDPDIICCQYKNCFNSADRFFEKEQIWLCNHHYPTIGGEK